MKTFRRSSPGKVCLALVASAWLSALASAFPVQISESPTNDLSLTLRAIRSAKRSLLINIYELTSDEIRRAIEDRIRNGVHVEILQEGQPVGRMSSDETDVDDKIVATMNESGRDCHFYLMTSDTYKSDRRFHYDHAKYMVIDGQSLVVGSENYSDTGNAIPGDKGTRGWETWLHAPALASSFSTMFEGDKSTDYGDVAELTSSYWRRPALFPSLPLQRGVSPARPPAQVYGVESTAMELADQQTSKTYDATDVESLTSPDTSRGGLIRFIQSASTTLNLELMSFNSKWGRTGKASPLLTALEDAARRGVKVRVLLNDDSVFARRNRQAYRWRKRKYTNQVTRDLINSIAQREGIPLSARIADLDAMGVVYIHNKGGLADDDQTLVSSINWNANSVENNRETAVILRSQEIHAHYQALFEQDWSASGG